MDKRILVEI